MAKKNASFIPLIIAAPMAGYTDQAFRRVLQKCGAAEVWTEMVSVAALSFNSKKTLELLKFDKKRGCRNVVQLFGSNPEHFRAAILSGHVQGFDEININAGCPARKIVCNGDGAALAKEPELLCEIIKACVDTAKVPVSVKIRLDNAKEIARLCEGGGAARLVVHGRFASAGYSGSADRAPVGEIVRAVKIPVIANGDIKCAESAAACIQITGAAGVMVGRALIGAPWKINPEFRIQNSKIKEIIKYHLKQAEQCGTSFAEMKKHLLAYCNHFENKKQLKQAVVDSKSFDEFNNLRLFG